MADMSISQDDDSIDIGEHGDLIYVAWTIIANASDWLANPDGEWVAAATRWRDEFHALLDAARP